MPGDWPVSGEMDTPLVTPLNTPLPNQPVAKLLWTDPRWATVVAGRGTGGSELNRVPQPPKAADHGPLAKHRTREPAVDLCSIRGFEAAWKIVLPRLVMDREFLRLELRHCK